MTDRNHRSRALLYAVLAAFACGLEEETTLEIVVRVEQRGFETGFPAQVLVGFDDGSGYVVFRVGVLCGPDPFVATSRFSAGASGGASTVDAWLAPLHAGAAFPCGPLPSPQPAPAPPARFARTSAQVDVLAGCGAGDVRTATLVLGPG